VRTVLLTNRTTAKERARLTADLAGGDVDIVVGTHALLTDDVAFASLGVAVIDEQHRFGVEQRAALRDKGGARPARKGRTRPPGHDRHAHPRTAAMVVFGDLDMTVLDELHRVGPRSRRTGARPP